jgi:DNA-binding response OmpR family regulator
MDGVRLTTKSKVLVIDDNPDIVDIIRRMLVLDGRYEPVVAYDGAAGLEAFERERPICVIIDAKMPQLDGFQLLRCLRGDDNTAETALVMLTALARETDRQQGLFSGADEYLTKPFRSFELLAAIERAIAVSPEERMERIRRMLADEEDGDSFASP